jgi:hypothetical protein
MSALGVYQDPADMPHHLDEVAIRSAIEAASRR